MTSLLRRKRRITAPNTPAAMEADFYGECPRGFLSLTIAAALVLACCLLTNNFASADDEGLSAGEQANKVVGATVKRKVKLRWLPYQPRSSRVENASEVRQVVQWTPAAPNTEAQKKEINSAFDDPFGDKKKTGAMEESTMPKESTASPSWETNPSTKEPNLPSGADLELNSNHSLFGPSGEPLPLDESLTNKRLDLQYACPSQDEFKNISELGTDITPSPGDLPKDCPWGENHFRPRSWQALTFAWTASGLCHKPLYFEDVKLERYGHMLGPWVQPFASGANFFLTVPILPYKMGLELPDECVYSLGYYRPGSCAPYMLDPLPISIRGALFEAGAWVGGAAVIP
ncbi:MAG: hypothetical protein ACWGMZ_03435 [Thermoguttaceae bacterium]